MIGEISLNSPGEAGIFEPFSGTTGLSFDIERLSPDIFHPAAHSWRSNWELFHEWAHFYQFATTNYGFYYNALLSIQQMLMNGFLRVYAPKLHRYRLPLLSGQPVRTFEELIRSSDGELGGGHIRQLQWLNDYRTAVYGHSVKPDLRAAFSGESGVMIELMDELFGFPRLLVSWPTEGKFLQQDRFRITDILESHAFALATLWTAQAVERFDLPKRITSDAIDYADLAAIGPYNAFLRYTQRLPASPELQTHFFCFLCDLSLNPPGPGFPPQPPGPQGKPPLYLIPDHNWDPVTRLWELILMALGGHLPVPDIGTPGWQDEFARQLKETMGLQGEVFAPFPRQQYDVTSVTDKIMQFNDMPQPLKLLILDRLFTFKVAQRMRESAPYLLGARMIEEFIAMTRHLGGPSGVCHFSGGRKVFSRVCMGLMNEGLFEAGDPTNRAGDELMWTGIPIVETFRLLMYQSKAELEPVSRQPLFGGIGLTLADILEGYGFDLDDFD